ncbi:pilus assembly protein TadG-related protein [uncultured Enterovirga sp.]|uniref:pilus assembly protein TadG-related protein n=1 Tax=uncultured Enterovirga sp. TaxID=2026352 RepID=UPI0035CAAAB6
MTLGLLAPLLFGFVGIAVDYSTWSAQQSRLQKAADAAALGGARELQLGKPDAARLQAIVESIVTEIAPVRGRDGPISVEASLLGGQSGTQTSSSTTSKDGQARGVKVTLRQRKDAIMSKIVTPTLTDIEVFSTASMSGGAVVCVIGLDETSADTIRLDQRALITAPGCAVYANSTNSVAIRSENQARVTSVLTCSAGGYRQSSSMNFQPRAPTTDCPKQPDPLTARQPPPSKSCSLDAKPLVLNGVTRTLSPDTYCGGLVVDKGARVTLLPGVYVMKNGPLIVGPGGYVTTAKTGGDDEDDDDDDDDEGGGSSTVNTGYLRGTNVGIYFTGSVKPEADGKIRVMKLMKNSVVELTAPKDGVMAGLLFHEDRSSAPDRRFEVLSDSARRLVGTIYMPRGIFNVSANQSVADQSEYTAIVSKRMELFQAPNLVLNTRYGDTDVPVPEGIGPNSQVRLTR